MDIPMAPGVGLYLNSLYFDFYRPENGNGRSNQKQPGNSGGASGGVHKRKRSDTVPLVASLASTPATSHSLAVDPEHETLPWQNVPRIVDVCGRFRHGVLWPHIMEQEESQLPYLLYLDYLRGLNYDYAPRPYVIPAKA
eukprot:gene7210-9231_t